MNGDSTNRKIHAEFRKNQLSHWSEASNKDSFVPNDTRRRSRMSSAEIYEDDSSPRLKKSKSLLDKNVSPKHNYCIHSYDEHGLFKNNPIKKQHETEKRCCSIDRARCNEKSSDLNRYKLKESKSDSKLLISNLELKTIMFQIKKLNKGGGDVLTCPFENSSGMASRTTLPEESVLPKTLNDLRSRQSSFTQFDTTPSSSLATIMSYHQAQKIFQSVEKNPPKSKKTRNITEFKKMEELGLGEVRNRRWYPGVDKTLSIWSGLHSTISGIQAQFCKYHKPVK